MSERGSFVTEYIYCEKCLSAVRGILIDNRKYLCSTQLNIYDTRLPIIAGKIGGSYANAELETFEYEIIPEIVKGICHSVRVAVLPDCGGDKVFNIEPLSGGKK